MARIQMAEADHQCVSEAVRRAEQETDGEIVTMVARQSDAYHDVALQWAMLSAFIVLGLAAAMPDWFERLYIWLLGGWQHRLPLWLFLTLLLGHMILKYLGVRLLLAVPALRMALTPGPTRTRRVHRRAVLLFRTAAEARTARRTGILIYLSLAERRAEIVADAAISAKVDPSEWGEAMAALLAEVKAGRIGAGMAAAVERVGVVLARHVPRREANPNELPDRLIEL